MTSFFEQMLKHHIFTFYGYLYPMNPGTSAFALFALLLFTLPEEFTFHVLFALPRLALRNRTFCA